MRSAIPSQLAVLAALFVTESAFGQTYPASLDAEFAPPRPTEVGAAANQIRFIALAGGSLGGFDAWKDVLAVGQGTIEYVSVPWLGVRGSSELAFPLAGGVQTWALRAGPSLHVLPYHRVDFGIFFEGGVASVDLFTKQRSLMPIVVGGSCVDVAITSSWMVRVEGHLTTGIADRSGAAATYGYATGLLGVGYVL